MRIIIALVTLLASTSLGSGALIISGGNPYLGTPNIFTASNQFTAGISANAAAITNLTVAGSVASSLVPSINGTYDLGAVNFAWRSNYLSSITCLTIDAPGFTVVGTGGVSITNLTITGNAGATLASGDTNVVDLNFASRTTVVTNAITFAHATNGVALVHKSQVRWFTAGGAGPYALVVPATWRTNMLSAVPAAITNGVITKMIVESFGACASAATQTNCAVSFEYYK